jgi:hypothetical protein
MKKEFMSTILGSQIVPIARRVDRCIPDAFPSFWAKGRTMLEGVKRNC